MALLYLSGRLVFRVGDFFHHWYVDGTKRFAHATISFFAQLDRTLALRMTAWHFSEPLYGDYTVIGHIMGFLFRFFRVLVGLAVYACVSVIVVLAAIVWLFLPPILFFYAVI